VHRHLPSLQSILEGDFREVDARWLSVMHATLPLWHVTVVGDRGRGVVALRPIPKGAIIAVYGGRIFDVAQPPRTLTHALHVKQMYKLFAIDGYWMRDDREQQCLRGAMANTTTNGTPNAKIVWRNSRAGRGGSSTLLQVPMVQLTRDVAEGEEITVPYSAWKQGTEYIVAHKMQT
jgi:hypothetical protein